MFDGRSGMFYFPMCFLLLPTCFVRGRDGQIKTIRDTLRLGPTAGQSATGLVRILITQKGDKRRQLVQETELYRFYACCFDS